MTKPNNGARGVSSSSSKSYSDSLLQLLGHVGPFSASLLFPDYLHERNQLGKG